MEEMDLSSLRSDADATDAKPTSKPSALLTSAMQIWNDVCGAHLAKVSKSTDTRRDKFARRFREDFGQDLEKWRAYCQRIAESPFLTNASGRNRAGWKADFDFVLEPSNSTKILEGVWDPQRQRVLATSDGFGEYR